MPKFRQAMEMSHCQSSSAACQHYQSIKASETKPIKKLEQKEMKLFPYYLITRWQQLCIVKEIYVMQFHQGTYPVQILIKVRLMQQNALLAMDTSLHVYKTWEQTCERLPGRLQRNVLAYVYWIAYELY